MNNFKPYFVTSSGYYDDKCAMCINYNIYDLKSAFKDGYSCAIRGSRRLAYDDSCTKQRKDRSRTQKDIKKAFEEMERKYGKYSPHAYSLWYITTVVCEILGNDFQEYQALGWYYRNEVLVKDVSEQDFLADYDTFGILVADSIKKDAHCEVVAYELFTNYIKPFYDAFCNGEYEAALLIHKEMFEKLKEMYQITDVTTYDDEHTHQITEDEMQRLRRSVN